jgi:hypothetical protein
LMPMLPLSISVILSHFESFSVILSYFESRLNGSKLLKMTQLSQINPIKKNLHILHCFEWFWVTLSHFLSHFWVIFDSFLSHFWVIFESLLSHFESFLSHFWVIFESFLSQCWSDSNCLKLSQNDAEKLF